MNAFIMRRRRLMRDREFAGLRVIAPRDSRDGRHLHDFLTKNHVPHRLIAFEEETGQALARAFQPNESRSAGSDHRHRRAAAPTFPARSGANRRPAPAARPATRKRKSAATSRSWARGRPAWRRRSMPARKDSRPSCWKVMRPAARPGPSSLIENFFGFPDRDQRRRPDLSRATPGLSFRREIFHSLAGP